MIDVEDDANEDEFILIDSKTAVNRNELNENESDENKDRDEEKNHNKKSIALTLLKSIKVSHV